MDACRRADSTWIEKGKFPMPAAGQDGLKAKGSKGLQDLADEDLMQLAQQGDAAAFAVLYGRYATVALALANRLVGDRSSAEDVTQDAFITLWRNRSSYSAERGSVLAWLLGILRHRAIDVERRRRVRERARSRANDLPPREAAAEMTDVEAERREQARSLRAELAALPTAQRHAIVLAYLGGLTHPEIAQRLDIPVGTVKGRIRLGLKKLQRATFAQTAEPLTRLTVATDAARLERSGGATARSGEAPPPERRGGARSGRRRSLIA